MKFSKRHVTQGDHIVSFTVMRLEFLDLVKLLFGRELYGFGVILQYGVAYEAFNLDASRSSDLEIAGSAPEPRDRA